MNIWETLQEQVKAVFDGLPEKNKKGNSNNSGRLQALEGLRASHDKHWKALNAGLANRLRHSLTRPLTANPRKIQNTWTLEDYRSFLTLVADPAEQAIGIGALAQKTAGTDQFAELELFRLAAILANGHNCDDNRFLVYHWLDKVMHYGPTPYDRYFATWRRNDEETYTADDKRVDPYMHEVRLFMLEKKQTGEILRAHWKRKEVFHEIVYPTVVFALQRYDFALAKLLLDGSEGPRRPKRLLHLRRFMPRLAAATFIGSFALLGQEGIWELAVNQSATRPLWSLAWGCTLLAIVYALGYVEVSTRSPRRGGKSKFRAISRMFCLSVLFALLAGLTLNEIIPLMNSAANNNTALVPVGAACAVGRIAAYILTVLALGSTGILIGWILQVLWDERPLTDPL